MGPHAVPLRVGVIGLGAMGRHHVASLERLPGLARVAAVADVDGGVVERVADRTGAAGHTDPAALIASADVDAVMVVSPDETHGAYTRACIRRGLPVLCEKPLTTSVEDAQSVAQAERETGRWLVQLGFMRRFDPDYRWIADRLAGSGSALALRSVHRNPLAGQPFDERMLVLNSASHDIDLLRWLLADEVAEVGCLAGRPASPDAATVVITVRMRRGAVGVVELSYGPGLAYEVGCEVTTTDGLLCLGTPPTSQRAMTADGPAAAAPPAGFVERFDAAYAAQTVAWLTSIGTGRGVGATTGDGVANVAVLTACARALEEGGTVEVPDPGRWAET